MRLGGSTEHHWRQGLRRKHLQRPSYTLLHRSLEGESSCGVLTGVELSLTVALGVDEGNSGEKGRGRRPAATQAKGRHKKLMWTLGQQ
jgi:hypothetical protein